MKSMRKLIEECNWVTSVDYGPKGWTVTLKEGWGFLDNPGCSVRGFDSLDKAYSGTILLEVVSKLEIDPKSFSKQQKKALWKSAKHYLKNWEACREGEFDDIRIYNEVCPCCKKWWLNRGCSGCPVAEFTGMDECRGTPYERVNHLMGIYFGYVEDEPVAEEDVVYDENGLPVVADLFAEVEEALEQEYRFLVSLALGEVPEKVGA